MKNEFDGLNTDYIVGLPFDGDSADETWTRQQAYQAKREMLIARQAAARLTWWQRLRLWWGGVK